MTMRDAVTRSAGRARVVQGRRPGPPPPGRPSIGQQIAQQESNLLRRGQAGPQRYNQIRQRQIWSTYYFTQGYAGSAITSNVLAAGEYALFTTISGSNGQGLPAGFALSELDTNTPSIGRVSDDQNFSIWELNCSVLPMRQDVVAGATASMHNGPIHPLDLDVISQNLIVVIKYLTNEVPLGFLADFVQPGGPVITAPSLLDHPARTATDIAGAGPAGQSGGLQESGVGGGLQVSPWGQRVAKVAYNSGAFPPSPALGRRFGIPIYLPNTSTFQFKIVVARPVTLLSPAQGGSGGFRLRLAWWAVESFRQNG